MKRIKAKTIFLLLITMMLPGVFALTITLSTQRVRAAATITVTNTNDSGAGSLRQAIAIAASGDTINFNLSYPATITLTSGRFTIEKDLTFNGPGANLLTISGNDTTRIFVINSGTISLNGITLSHGKDTGRGAAISSQGTLTLTNCVLSNNTADVDGEGGALSNFGTATLINCTVSENRGNRGGGIRNAGTLIIENSTFFNNRARLSGGAIYEQGNVLSILNSTFFANQANAGGGILLVNSGNVTLRNSIVAGSQSQSLISDIQGTVNFGDYNLVEYASNVSLSGTHNITGQSPLLGPLQNNGGPTPTMAPGCGSPAIDMGDNTFAGSTDQRGLTRIQDGNGDSTAVVDMGAVEKENACPTITAQTLSLAKNSTQAGLNIATVNDGEDAEQNLSVKANGSSSFATTNGVSLFLSQPNSSGLVTANIQATCTATNATFTLSVTDSAGQTVETLLNVTVTASNSPMFISCPGNISKSNDPGQCSAVVTYAPTASDDCNGSLTPVCSPASGTTFQKGTTPVTCTATDSENQIATCSFTVTVQDAQAPAINCPANMVQSTDANQCSASVTYAVTANDVCDGSLTPVCKVGNTVITSPHIFAKGTTTVSCTASDSAGNQSSPCSFTVTVNDTQAPTITCPTNIVKATDPNQCSAVVTFAAPTVNDNCPNVGTPICTPASGSSFPKGVTNVNCTVSDASKQSANCSFTVTVNDTQPPAITCPANFSVPTATGQCAALVTFAAPAVSDNCPGIGAPICAPPSGSSFAKGVTMVNCSVRDAANNQSVCAFTVTVNDTQVPALICPDHVLKLTARPGDAAVIVSYPAPTASDNCGTPNVTCNPPAGTAFPVGTTIVTCTATDTSMNTTSCLFTITVFDVCLQDDNNTNNTIVWNSLTGDYRYCCSGTSFTGKGVVTRKGNIFTLMQSAGQRVNATVDAAQNKGNATMQSAGTSCTIIDRDIRNNSGLCALGGGSS